jgi:hypothetical protein
LKTTVITSPALSHRARRHALMEYENTPASPTVSEIAAHVDLALLARLHRPREHVDAIGQSET